MLYQPCSCAFFIPCCKDIREVPEQVSQLLTLLRIHSFTAALPQVLYCLDHDDWAGLMSLSKSLLVAG